jgi:uncharacterized protein
MKKTDSGNGLWLYFGLTYALMLLTWGLMAVFHISGASVVSSGGGSSSTGLVLLFLGGFTPTIAAIAVTALDRGRPGLRDLWDRVRKVGIGGKWYLLIFLLPILLAVLRVGIYLAGGGAIARPAPLASPAALVVFTIPLLLVGPISEEAGWRGYALDRMLDRWRPLPANLVVAAFWAVWHLPLFFITGTIQQIHGDVLVEFPLFVLQVLGLTVFFNWIYANTRSVFATILAHFIFNWIYSFSATCMESGRLDRLVNALLYLALAVVITYSSRKSRPSASRP